MRTLPALVLAAALAGAGAAAAQTPPPAPYRGPALPSPELRQAKLEQRRLCKPEIERLCPGAHTMDKLARRQCMKAHRKEFSPACTQARLHYRDLRRAQQG